MTFGAICHEESQKHTLLEFVYQNSQISHVLNAYWSEVTHSMEFSSIYK